MKKIRIGILGTGNIGTDLLFKCMKKDYMDIVAFVGRRDDSETINMAKNKNINTSSKGIDFFIEHPNICDIVYDCTNAYDAKIHANIFEKQSTKVIDLTPAKVGIMCVPDINASAILSYNNINMITCGGQASLPILNILNKYYSNIEYIEIVSQIASKSAGMATRINIDEYINTTKKAIMKFTKCVNNKVILNLNPAEPCVDMQTTIFMKSSQTFFDCLTEIIIDKIRELKTYIPHYELILQPMINQQGILVLSIKVKGSGDYLPAYAGNLDIINCAAIKITENLL